MTPQNFTAIDDLVKKKQIQPTSKPKEFEPTPASEKKYEIKENAEHQPTKEVQPFVQPRAETIELPPDLKKMGLHAVSTTQFPTQQNITLPISDDKIVSGLHAPITSSLRWLATFAVYLLKQVHLTLKVVHGHVVRVMRG
ncbi:hypothetical protein HYW87_01570 [Candidatus Roizmanbacteria bacterium]|nr:hypothetical protein [Candidatus Roizmanbacteria bacterium]